MYYVYILKSEKDNSFYIGWTIDIRKRIKRHNTGRTRYTKTRAPWVLVYKEEYKEKAEAIKREKQLKRFKNRRVIESLIRRGVEQSGSSSGS